MAILTDENLERLYRGLADSARDVRDVVSISIETGPDAAVLLGTEPAFLRLAAELLATLLKRRRGGLASEDIEQMVIHCATHLRSFDPAATVVPTCLMITGSDEERGRLAKCLDRC
jgi:hypothetical protein